MISPTNGMPYLNRFSRHQGRILGATDSTEGKYYKTLFQYLNILLNSFIFKLLPFSTFNAEYYIKLTICHYSAVYAICTVLCIESDGSVAQMHAVQNGTNILLLWRNCMDILRKGSEKCNNRDLKIYWKNSLVLLYCLV